MSSVEIASGAPEPIRVEYLIDGEPVLSSITVKADVRRVGGQVLDWNDATFKAIGSVVQRYVTLTEDGASYPGRYSYTWNTSTITNAAASDVYQVMVYDDSEIIGMGEIRVGTVDTIDDTAADVTTILGYTPAATAAATWATVITGNETLEQAGGALNVLRGALLNPLNEADGDPGTLILKKNDGVTTWVTWTLLDQNGGAVVGSPGEPARRSAGT